MMRLALGVIFLLIVATASAQPAPTTSAGGATTATTPPAPAPPDKDMTVEEAGRRANELVAQGRWAEAAPLAQWVVAEAEHMLGPSHPRFAVLVHDLGVIRLHMGELGAAEALFERAVAIVRRSNADDRSLIRLVAENMAIAATHSGDPAEAKRLGERALAIVEDNLEAGSGAMANALLALGSVFAPRSPHLAARLYRRALVIRRRIDGEQSLSAADAMQRLAHSLRLAGDLEAAEKLLIDVLAIVERERGLAHASYALATRDLADVYVALGEHERAEQRLSKLLANLQSTQDADHPAIAATLYHLGKLLWAERKTSEAREALQRSLAAHEAGNTATTPQAALVLSLIHI